MTMSIISMFVPMLVKVLGSWIDNQILKGAMKKEAKDDFLKFVGHIDSANKMADVRQDTKDQYAELTQQNKQP